MDTMLEMPLEDSQNSVCPVKCTHFLPHGTVATLRLFYLETSEQSRFGKHCIHDGEDIGEGGGEITMQCHMEMPKKSAPVRKPVHRTTSAGKHSCYLGSPLQQ